MRINIFIFIFLSFSSSNFIYGQLYDQVFFKGSKEIIKGKVLKVDSQNIEIDPEGDIPFLIIKRSEVKLIIYSDNTVVNFENSNGSTPAADKKIFKRTNEGFRTDGFYITDTPFEYKHRKQESVTGLIVRSAQKYLYVAFRIIPSKENDFEDYREIQVAYFNQRRSDLKDKIRDNSNLSWKEIRQTILTDDKVKRTFIENDLKKKSEGLIAVQFKFYKPYIRINDKEGLVILIGNFTGLNEDVPKADFMVSRVGLRLGHPKYENNKEFDQDAYWANAKSDKYWVNTKSVELEFIKD